MTLSVLNLNQFLLPQGRRNLRDQHNYLMLTLYSLRLPNSLWGIFTSTGRHQQRTMTEPTDENLMHSYRQGDTAAFDRLYARHRGPLFRYIDRLSNNHAETEELFQDVWMRMIRARDQWRQEKGFKPWLYRIAHNRLVDHWRAAKGQQVPLEDDTIVSMDKSWPDAWLVIKDCIERLFHLLGGLSEPQRSAFLLKEEANLSLAEIADVTGVGRETVKSRLRYALRSLRSGLEGCDE